MMTWKAGRPTGCRLRPGEPLKVIMINRASGYIGTESVDFSKNEAGGPISFSPARIEMQAPNLKISVARKHLVEAGLSKGAEYTNLIGFEGSGLTSMVSALEELDQYPWTGHGRNS